MDYESCLKENFKKDHFYETALKLRQDNSNNVFPDDKGSKTN